MTNVDIRAAFGHWDLVIGHSFLVTAPAIFGSRSLHLPALQNRQHVGRGNQQPAMVFHFHQQLLRQNFMGQHSAAAALA